MSIEHSEIINLKRYFNNLASKISSNNNIYKDLIKVKDLIINTKKNNSRVLIFGNGGSAAIASHVSVDLTKKFESQSHEL